MQAMHPFWQRRRPATRVAFLALISPFVLLVAAVDGALKETRECASFIRDAFRELWNAPRT